MDYYANLSNKFTVQYLAQITGLVPMALGQQVAVHRDVMETLAEYAFLPLEEVIGSHRIE